MTLFGRRFRPARWSIPLTLAGISLFVLLGNWQLERAAYKQSIEDRYEQRLQQAYQRYSDTSGDEDLQYRKLVFDGSFDNERQLLLDNQTHRGRAGYQVLTPLRLRDSDEILLVNRGWAPWGENREVMPAILPAQGGDSVAGIAFFPGDPALRLGTYMQGDAWPRLVPYVDIERIGQEFEGRLLPFVLWLAPERPGAYLREWSPVWLPPEKSRAYAVQWFAFALLALALFIVLNLRKDE